MSLISNYQYFADYNHWMTSKIYDVTRNLDEADLKKDRGAFFKSIHSTMNHILWADIRWINRFRRDPYRLEAGKMGEDLFDDYQELAAEHLFMADYIREWTQSLTSDDVEGDYIWTPAWGGDPITKPLHVVMSHMFNHQTHHRGQVTQMLKPMGLDVGDTDMPLMP